MIISMQGNWTVAVKSKNAAYPQRFVVQGATTGNGVHSGTTGTSVFVTGTQWSIAIQNDPGTGFQSSETQLKFPQNIGGNYTFDIHSNDAGGDTDFNDLILTCSTPVNINDFIIYGNVTRYSGRCIFNPCRRFPFVIDTYDGLLKAVKNPVLSDYIKEYYPERIPKIDPPFPPNPQYFKPISFDLNGEAMQPKTALSYKRIAQEEKKGTKKAAKDTASPFAATNFELIHSERIDTSNLGSSVLNNKIKLAESIDGLFLRCNTDPGSNLTLTFEEYDRTAAELSGGAYTGEGNRELQGDTITDMNGNYIFRFSFDMTFPGLEDINDYVVGENFDKVMFPDIIVKVVEYSPFHLRYESVPFYNIPNLKRINLCLPESIFDNESATCFNGNMIGSLGNVFIGGDQNDTGSTSAPNTTRHGYSNYLESSGVISVESPLAGFNIQCAAWRGTIDMKGCMYDATKSAAENKISWYTIRIKREGTSGWDYVSQNYKHPKYSNRNLPNYIGDDVGPFYPTVGPTFNGLIPAYTNIQREIFVDGIDWEFSNLSRYMRLNTMLYDVVSGVRTPGKFFVRIDGYDANGAYVNKATDLIALFIHNNGLNFEMTTPALNDPSIVNAGCGLFRLTDDQMKTPIEFSFKVNDPNGVPPAPFGSQGFVDNYRLTMSRCPGTAIELNANIEVDPPSNVDGEFTLAGGHTFSGGTSPLNVRHHCPGYKGTHDDYSDPGLIDVQIVPQDSDPGWIKVVDGEYFTVYSFGLTANQRVTNGYNTGLSSTYRRSARIMMERLNP